jgi:hypothetical protein
VAHQSPFSDDVHREWERLVFRVKELSGPEDREPPPERVEGWRRLYERTFRDGEWLVSSPDASLVASLGVTIALRQRRFEDALVLARQYLDHPEAESDDRITRQGMMVRAAMAELLTGRTDEGIGRLLDVLRSEPRNGSQSGRLDIRVDLYWVLQELGWEEPADPRLVRFVGRLLQGWRGKSDKAPLAAACRTHGDIARLLDSTYAQPPE